MKKVFSLLLLFCVYLCYSQTHTNKFKDKYEEFGFYAQPSKFNELSKFFKNHINTDLLKAVKFQKDIENEKRIFLTFRFNDKGDMVNIYATSAYSELNNNIVEAFKKYEIEKLNIPEKSPKNKYVLQIISSEEDIAVINCSSVIVYDRMPVFEGCDSENNYNKIKQCLRRQIESHIISNLSLIEVQKAKLLGEINLKINFTVEANGNIINAHCKGSTEAFNNELDRVIGTLPRFKIPPTRNGIPTSYDVSEEILFIIESKTESYKENVLETRDSVFERNEDLEQHFTRNLSEKELDKIFFPLKSNALMINFSLDKKGKMIDARTNSNNPELSKKLIRIFNSYPLEKLNITNNDILNMYSYHLITRFDNKNIVRCNKAPIIMTPPMFKGCEKSKSPDLMRKCMSELVGRIIKKEFDTNLRYKTSLTGIIRILAHFKIDKEGKITGVKVKAPNPFLGNEIESIIQNITPAIKPGYQNGKPVVVPFSVPIVFSVGDYKPLDSFKELNKKF
ncbi:hypothetical protein [Litoribaculum gwangyangense]|uniref:TonB C-terminal domain-containing protein n=1 Tax=Litoribaculum gwangyangense TaxID=1130722 RepID=A0ABP9CGV1_9FLAO